jgi:hypothetical protein
MNLSQTKKVAMSALGLLLAVTASNAHAGDKRHIRFALSPNPKFLECLARFPNDPRRPPRADVLVTRGKFNDSLRLLLHDVKPGLQFDLFTVERSTFLADGSPDPAAPNRGLAWYQSDVDVSSSGSASVEIRTILLDQIFGFDPIVNLQPTNTFHVGIWFNDPNDVEACDPTKPTTPFNGDHNAGPLAMISLPDAASGLGPLCTSPNFSTNPPSCNP